MKYTADQIRSYQFQKSGLSGYKAYDVDDFLDNIAKDYDEMQKRQEEFAMKIQVLADKINEYRENEDAVKYAILNAQKTGDGILKERKETADKYYEEKIENADKVEAQAKETAEKLISEAQIKAQEILDRSTMESKNILNRAQINAKTLRRETETKIKEEQEAYEALKAAVDEFKDELFDAYKKHMTFISSIKTKNIEIKYTENTTESDDDNQTNSDETETKSAE